MLSPGTQKSHDTVMKAKLKKLRKLIGTEVERDPAVCRRHCRPSAASEVTCNLMA